MPRKGLDFTLTLVVIGVVLLMTALTVIVLGTGGVANWFGGQQDRQASTGVEAACNGLAQQIDQNYCNTYVKQSSCTSTSTHHNSSHDKTASERDCRWNQDGISNDELDELLVNDQALVEVGNNRYDCVQQGYMTYTCPASTGGVGGAAPTIPAAAKTDGGSDEGGTESSDSVEDRGGGSPLGGDVHSSVGGPADELTEFDETGETLQYNILQSNIPSKVTSPGVNPQIKAETNADRVFLLLGDRQYRLYDDGSHGDKSADDKWYGNYFEAPVVAGEHTAAVLFVKGDEEEVGIEKSITFKISPDPPKISTEFSSNNITVVGEYDYPENPQMTVKFTVKREGKNVAEKARARPCSERCTVSLPFEAQQNDEAHIEAYISYKSVSSDSVTDVAVYSAGPRIFDAAFHRENGAKVVDGGSWRATIAVSKAGFTREDIKQVSLTKNGASVGQFRQGSFTVGSMSSGTADKEDAAALKNLTSNELSTGRIVNQNYPGSPSSKFCVSCNFPKDIDGDGVYADINGSGRVDQADYDQFSAALGNGQKLSAKYYDFDGDDLAGDVLPIGTAVVNASEVEAGDTLSLKIDLTSSAAFSKNIVKIAKVEDTTAPELRVVSRLGTKQNGEVRLNMGVFEDFQKRISCQAEVVETNEALGNCSTTLTPGKVSYTIFSFTPPNDVGQSRIRFYLEDAAGNQRIETSDPIILNPEKVIVPFEVHGSADSKVNLAVYGHNMSTAETQSMLRRNIGVLFGDTPGNDRSSGSTAWKGVGYRDYFNWYIVDASDLCKSLNGFREEGTKGDCSDGIQQIRDAAESALDGERSGIVLLTKRPIRAFAVDDYTVIGAQEEFSTPFSHELGHLIWAFNDEYKQHPAKSNPMDASHFFPQSMNSDSFDVYKHPNTWKERENCISNVTTYYDVLRPDDCSEVTDGGHIIYDEDIGKSLMNHQMHYTLYEHHKTRIKHLMENNPKYNGDSQ